MRHVSMFIATKLLSKCAVASFALISTITSPAYAFKTGHGSVLSDTGASLQIAIPLLELTPEEANSIQVKLADEDAWTKVGLTPPVALSTLKVEVVPGFTPGSRRLMLSSAWPARQSPVDVLVDVTTSSGATRIQSSYLVTLPADITKMTSDVGSDGQVRATLAGTGQMLVQPGNTLYAIAQKNAVPGTDTYQMLVALFEANPDAFISNNMNMLRAGAVLNMPDANVVRAIDKANARKIFQNQVKAFNEIKLTRQAARTAASKQSQSTSVKSGATKSTVTGNNQPGMASQEASAGDQVRLKSNNPADQKEDVRTAAKNETEEINSRIKVLQDNVDKLKNESTSGSSTSSSTATTASTSTTAPAPTSSLSPSSTAHSVTAGSTVTTTDTAASTNASSTKTVQAAQTEDKNTTLLSNLFSKWNTYTSLLSENIIFALAALIALGALVIAWMMRRAGERHDDESEELTAAARAKPEPVIDISQKLDGIDLNLDPVDVKNSKPIA